MIKSGRGPVPKAGDSPDVVTKLAVKRTKRYLAEVRTRYPEGFTQLNAFARMRGKGGMDWPDWCWLPLGGSYAVVSGGGSNRIAPTDPRAADMPRLAALAAWRLTKGVFWLEPDVQEEHVARMWKAPRVPADPPLRRERYLSGLPQHCVYVALPPMNGPVEAGSMPWPLGVFVHLEHDMNNGRPELRLVVDTDGTWDGLTPHPVLLDRPTLLASTRELAQGATGLLARIVPGLFKSEGDAELLAEFARTFPFQVWPVVEAITDSEAVISGWDRPEQRPEPAKPVHSDRGVQWEPVGEAARWRIGRSAPKPALHVV
ncbi:hypothetical protein ABT024_05240 [Streptomyces sp. NPDC002812]|uniref:hypothetical protein n=1 Tax=Streptomyces sp. NPDC002812 TaxID=3154434 RepID=UPI0033232EB1